MTRAYGAFFQGQFSWLGSSIGVINLAYQARKLGIEADWYGYTQWQSAVAKIEKRRYQGFRIMLLGYSLGNTTTGYIQLLQIVDLMLCIAMSEYAGPNNYHIKHAKRSVLWRGDGPLSSAGGNLGFNVIHDVHNVPHLLMQFNSQVVAGVNEEMRNLLNG